MISKSRRQGLGILLCTLLTVLLFISWDNPAPKLVWSDEFDGDALDLSKWTAIKGDGCPGLCGFGNQELQHYSDRAENLKVEDGKLIITARKESLGKSDYSSAKVLTKGKGDWKYGRIEVMAKLPEGRGTWPAIWMLPTRNKYGNWPRSGEIDIMEHVGFDQGKVFGTIHTQSFNHMKQTEKNDSLQVNDASTAFHLYAVEWHEDKIDWFIDDKKYFTFENSGRSKDDWPFDHPYHLILNIAVGGSWGGKYGIDDSIWPQTLEIDYVRVYTF